VSALRRDLTLLVFPDLICKYDSRQRQTNATTTPFALAQRYLPRELLQELRMAQPSISRLRKIRQLERLDEEEEGGD
jgi:hypothetical protein